MDPEKVDLIEIESQNMVTWEWEREKWGEIDQWVLKYCLIRGKSSDGLLIGTVAIGNNNICIYQKTKENMLKIIIRKK